MTVPRVTAVRLGGSPALPLLLLGPSLGTSARALWSSCAANLAEHFEVLAWDLPGHGSNIGTAQPFTMAELATGVLDLVDDMLAERGDQGAPFYYSGDSVGGAIGLQLTLDAPDRVQSVAVMCTGAKIGDPPMWHERAASVRASGTPVVVEGSAARWFAAGFLDREPAIGAALLQSLQDADKEGYAQVCEALADFDVRERLGEISTPLLAIAGNEDTAAPVAGLEQIAHDVKRGRLVVLDKVAHLAPAEDPSTVARLLVEHFLPSEPKVLTMIDDVREAGMTVRREVLGAAHVDLATANATEFTAEFQDFITQYAWGTIWTRPGLDRRSRSLITLTALVARGHHEELALHVRAARTNGLTNHEIKELLLQTAIYCGVPDANTAFRIAQGVLADIDAEENQA